MREGKNGDSDITWINELIDEWINAFLTWMMKLKAMNETSGWRNEWSEWVWWNEWKNDGMNEMINEMKNEMNNEMKNEMSNEMNNEMNE